jgi:ATP-dependent DNA helicase RecQ
MEREANDVARVESVLAMAEQESCMTCFLLDYFGESREACGHCSRCAGEAASQFDRLEPWSPTAGDMAVLRGLRNEGLPALATPRQMARFLCGITSPATTRAKLRQRKEFGVWNDHRFAEVLALTERR